MGKSHAPDDRPAYLAGIVCYALWGVLPLYFHLLAAFGVGSFETVAHRALWSAPWALALVVMARQGAHALDVLRRPKTLAILALSTLAILCNWTIYVAAVDLGQVIEASLGYYINPLMNMAAGALFFRERMNRSGQIAVALAAIGVAIQTAALGRVPAISLSLAVTFCIYAILAQAGEGRRPDRPFHRMRLSHGPGPDLRAASAGGGAGHFGDGAPVTLLLMAAGPSRHSARAVRLVGAPAAVERGRLSAIPFADPAVLLGVAFGEAFTPMRALSFAFIWLGVGVFAIGAWRRRASGGGLRRPRTDAPNSQRSRYPLRWP